MLFHEGQDLPLFAAFILSNSPDGERALRKYFSIYAELARKFDAELILETATWRSSADWGAKLGYDSDAVAEANRKAVRLIEGICSEYATKRTPIVISGCIGPRGGGYIPGDTMSEREAQAYHRNQIENFADTAADMVSGMTMNYVEEAIGIARAAKQAEMPVALSFTIETDGNLPTGQPLAEAICQVEGATQGYPAYFMINCAHPTHIDRILHEKEPWAERIRGLRANASRMSHQEQNEAAELDAGNPAELGREYAALKSQKLTRINVMGGCCGTDLRHVEQIAIACLPQFRRTAPR